MRMQPAGVGTPTVALPFGNRSVPFANLLSDAGTNR